MSNWLDLDWHRIFVPAEPLLELVFRGSCMYLSAFCLLRIFRRQTGSIGPADLLVLLLIADAAQNGMADEYRSVTEGIVLVATIIFWEYLLDWLGFRFPQFGALLERPPLALIADGQVLHRNLHQELLTLDELRSHLRQKGVDDEARVRACFLEGDGQISVILATPSTTISTGDHSRLA